MRMHSHALLVLLLCSLLAGPANAEPSPDPTYKDCHPGYKAALLAVKAALGEPYHLSGWTSDSPCCDWNGVTCDNFTGRVVSLAVFQDANITGTIPSALAGLPHLQDLTLRHLPLLSGPIPPAIGKLSNLSSLRISWTAVSGPCRPSWARSRSSPSSNSPSTRSPAPSRRRWGPSPTCPASTSAATASRAPSRCSSAGLRTRSISGYRTTTHRTCPGKVRRRELRAPRPVAQRPDWRRVGPLWPREGFAVMDLSRNAFDFDLSAVMLPEQIYTVDLSHNAIHGSIPAQVASAANLNFFSVSYNRLCGPVPTGGNMARFDLDNFQHNKCLCGAPLPPCKK